MTRTLEEKTAETMTQQRADAVDNVTQQRITIQLAANAAWPHTDQANATFRRAFQLPVNHPFNG